jgi:hypothetical protein
MLVCQILFSHERITAIWQNRSECCIVYVLDKELQVLPMSRMFWGFSDQVSAFNATWFTNIYPHFQSILRTNAKAYKWWGC